MPNFFYFLYKMDSNEEDVCCCDIPGRTIDISYDEKKDKWFMICSLCDKFIDFCE